MLLDIVREKKPESWNPRSRDYPSCIILCCWPGIIEVLTLHCRRPTGPAEPVGESDKGYACDKNGEVKRVLEPTCHDGAGDFEVRSRLAESPRVGEELARLLDEPRSSGLKIDDVPPFGIAGSTNVGLEVLSFPV